MNSFDPMIVVHGGAGNIPSNYEEQYNEGVLEAVRTGWKKLDDTNNALEAVVEAVKSMEDNPTFNAGYGSTLTIKGTVEMDALVIDGSSLRMGGVMRVSKVKNPIVLSKAILEENHHVLYAGEGAHMIAQELGFELIDPEQLITPRSRDLLEKYIKKLEEENKNKKLAGKTGTVGAVAIDSKGRLAAATSTGGIRGKKIGRVGDTPIPGAGTWADDIMAFSATGVGEWIIRSTLGLRTKTYLLSSKTTEIALMRALEDMKHLVNGTAGAIIITKEKGWAAIHTTKNMAWAKKSADGELSFLK